MTEGAGAPPIDVAATRGWAAEHKAAWEIEPFFETHGGARVQVGFELDLYARVPAGKAYCEPDLEALWDRLRAIAESLLPSLGDDARIEVDAFEAADRFRPETQFAAEVLLQARLVRAGDFFAAVGGEARGEVRSIEQRLAELGLRARSW